MKRNIYIFLLLSFAFPICLSGQCSLSLELQTNNALCADGQSGSVEVTASNAALPLSYTLTGVLGETGTSADSVFVIDELADGTYYLTVTDAIGCTQNISFEVGEITPMVGSVHVFTDGCGDDCDYIADLTVSGGTPPYVYLWSNGDTTQDLDGLCMGVVPIVQISDANGCLLSNLSIIITEPNYISVVALAQSTSCNGAMDGRIDVFVSGGTAPYTYLWNYQGATTQGLDSLSAGAYQVTITDANGCTAVAAEQVTEPSRMVTTIQVASANCSIDCGIELSLFVSGGTPPYTYLWSTDDTIANPTGLCVAELQNLAVRITDANGCIYNSLPVTLATPNGLDVDATVYDVLCNGETDGGINLHLTGGVPPFTYLWSEGSITEDLSGLGAGNYFVTVTDSEGCTITLSVEIEEPDSLITEFTFHNLACPDDCDVEVDLTVTGGTPPYGYLWSNGEKTEDLQGICGKDLASLSVIITDSNGCSYQPNVTTGLPLVLSATAEVQGVSCDTCADGSIELNVIGGVPPFTYLWSSGAITNPISNLSQGEYTVTVTDGEDCTFVVTAEVSVSTGLQELANNWSLRIHPNPAAQFAMLEFTLPAAEQLQIQLLDMYGRVVQQVLPPEYLAVGQHSFEISRANLPVGIYLLKVQNSSHDFFAGKIVFE